MIKPSTSDTSTSLHKDKPNLSLEKSSPCRYGRSSSQKQGYMRALITTEGSMIYLHPIGFLFEARSTPSLEIYLAPSGSLSAPALSVQTGAPPQAIPVDRGSGLSVCVETEDRGLPGFLDEVGGWCRLFGAEWILCGRRSEQRKNKMSPCKASDPMRLTNLASKSSFENPADLLWEQRNSRIILLLGLFFDSRVHPRIHNCRNDQSESPVDWMDRPLDPLSIAFIASIREKWGSLMSSSSSSRAVPCSKSSLASTNGMAGWVVVVVEFLRCSSTVHPIHPMLTRCLRRSLSTSPSLRAKPEGSFDNFVFGGKPKNSRPSSSPPSNNQAGYGLPARPPQDGWSSLANSPKKKPAFSSFGNTASWSVSQPTADARPERTKSKRQGAFASPASSPSPSTPPKNQNRNQPSSKPLSSLTHRPTTNASNNKPKPSFPPQKPRPALQKKQIHQTDRRDRGERRKGQSKDVFLPYSVSIANLARLVGCSLSEYFTLCPDRK